MVKQFYSVLTLYRGWNPVLQKVMSLKPISIASRDEFDWRLFWWRSFDVLPCIIIKITRTTLHLSTIIRSSVSATPKSLYFRLRFIDKRDTLHRRCLHRCRWQQKGIASSTTKIFRRCIQQWWKETGGKDILLIPTYKAYTTQTNRRQTLMSPMCLLFV